MTVQEATQYTIGQLKKIYEESEAANITDWLMEHLTGTKKTERLLYKNSIPPQQEILLDDYTQRLLNHEPVQYILNEAWFFGLKLYVDKNVLIPRPETEELVDWIITDCKFPIHALSILDIGTGSGAIPIALKRKLRKADVWSCDISEAAIAVAQKNADDQGTDIHFLQIDFLYEHQRNNLPSFDIIISNPPYIPEKDATQMRPNVLQYEPATALFVPDKDPLIFYTAIADFGKQHLNINGIIYTEIHEDLGEATTRLFQENGYTTELKKDMQGKDRMIKATPAIN